MGKMVITPKTKIHDLLEAYPELEDTLIKAAPQFKKLKNPLLRKTIARVTTLSQAAMIGGLKVEELINTLREEAGQQITDDYSTEEHGYEFEMPDWFSGDRIVSKIDIRDMLNAGEQPVHEVLSAIKRLEGDGILEIKAPFLPAPLIDKATGLGYRHWIHKIEEEEIYVYFRK
ncbi:MAG: DUF1858 domain-containing protein [Bacteroidales bacterium]|nr:DUF1858 domain-containing protein [Bacteroidales bacterium]